MLTGYKTYIMVAILVAIALAEGLLGIDIPGAEVQNDWLTIVGGALGLAGLRAAK